MMLERRPLQAVEFQLRQPFHHVALAAVSLDQLVEVIAALAALGAFDAEQVELAFDVPKTRLVRVIGSQDKRRAERDWDPPVLHFWAVQYVLFSSALWLNGYSA
jgi:hypothetical protein